MFPTEVLNNFARGTFRRIKIDAIILSGRWKSWRERKRERKTARKGVTPRDERRGIVGRLLTSMHLLTCSNGLRYFHIKLTAGGQVSRWLLVPSQCIENAKIFDGPLRHRQRSAISKHLIRFAMFSLGSTFDHETVFFPLGNP